MSSFDTMGWEQKLGRAITHWRHDHGCTQAELANLLGPSQPTISNYERGNLGGNVRLAVDIALALKLSLCALGAWILEDLANAG